MQQPATHPQTIEEAASLIRAGEICAFATETVYGLGADATNPDAVLKIYQAKARPRFNPLIVHCADLNMAARLVEFSPLAQRLAEVFWPGPLTLVLPLKPDAGISDIVTAGLSTLAVRVPGLETARALIAAVGRPLAAPSANPSGRLSPTSAAQVRRAFDDQVPVLDGGACSAGLESTIIAVDGERLVQLRAGALPLADIERMAGGIIERAGDGDAVAAPGMLKSHYAPASRLRLDAKAPRPGEAFLAFADSPVHEGPTRNLSPTGNLEEAARNLFAMLQALDDEGAATIAVAPIPNAGLGEAINDRLKRAAAPRT